MQVAKIGMFDTQLIFDKFRRDIRFFDHLPPHKNVCTYQQSKPDKSIINTMQVAKIQFLQFLKLVCLTLN